MWWPRRRRPRADRALVEPLEPRILYAADLAAAAMLTDIADPEEGAVQTRLIDAEGDYAAAPVSTASETPAPAEAPTAAAARLPLPLNFEVNAGQVDASIDFIARGNGVGIALADGNATLVLRDGERTDVVTMTLAEARGDAVAHAEGEVTSRSNYLIGSADRWLLDVANHASVRYDGVYEGIDLRYYGNGRALEYDFLVAPGADWRVIALQFSGVDRVTIEADGALRLTMDGAGGAKSLSFAAPVTYQTGPEGREAVASRYLIGADGRVRFDIGAYDTGRALVIDPLLVYGSYLGGTGQDSARGIALDAAGNAYITGETASAAFPTTAGVFDTTQNGSNDVFVTKVNAAGTAVIYSTFIGGSGDDIGRGIAVDAAGNAYVAGSTTSSNLPTVNAFQGTRSGSQDAFFFKLNAAGNALDYSTYYGGSGNGDVAHDVAVDAAGRAYVVGDATSASGIASAGAFDTTLGGASDAFLVKFDPTQSGAASRLFGTYLGGSIDESGYAVAVDAAGRAYVAGYTSSGDLPMATNRFDNSYNGGHEAFLAVLNAAGSALTYSTYLGGGGNDAARAIALDAAGNVYLSGSAGSGFPTKSAYDTSYGGGASDAFVAKINPALSGAASLIYSTYLGGSGDETALGIVVDAPGRAHVTGETTATLPTTADALQASYAGGATDAFYATLGSLGTSLVYSTHLGGSGADAGYSIAQDAAGNILIAGLTASADLQPITGGAYDTTHNGTSDAFVLKFGSPTLVVTTTADIVDGATTSIAALLANKGADGLISLREAIIATNNTAGADSIALAAGTYTLTRAGLDEDAASTGDLDITGDLTIIGAGATSAIVDGNALNGVFDVLPGVNAVLNDLTIRGGVTAANGLGGGVYVASGASLTLSRAIVTANSAGSGAGVYNNGMLTATDTTFSGNAAFDWGGGLYNDGGVLSLQRVTISGNTAGKDGGGICNAGSGATLSLTNVTVSNNTAADDGGGIYTDRSIVVTNSTIAFNASTGGVDGIHTQGAATATLKNTLLYNPAGINTNAALTSAGNNLDSDGSAGLSGGGDLSGTLAVPLNPNLGILQNNGGSIQTHALLAGSVALNAGTASGAPTADARGVGRLGTPDIGSYESTLIAYEPFAYAAGSFNGANGGLGWAAGWSDAGSNTSVTSGGLNAPASSMPVAGGAARFVLPSASGFITQTREMSATLGAAGSTAWLSFLIQPTTATTGDYAGVQFGSPAGTLAFAGFSNGQFGISRVGDLLSWQPVGGITPQVGQTYLLSIRMDFTAGADTLTLYVNPTPGQPAADSVFTASKNNLDLGTFTQVGLSGGRTLGTNDALLDEVRLAASFLDVAPSVAQHAPVLDATKSPALTAQTEDAGAPVGAVGTLVSSLVDLTGGGGLDNVTDADNGALTGIAVTAAHTVSGSWWYSIDGGSNWTALGAVADTSARLFAADASTRLYFQPNANYNGALASALTFRAWDQTAGSNGALADTTLNGASTAFSSATDTASLTITAVNDAPVLAGANNLNAINEDIASGANSGTLVSALIAGQLADPDSAAASGIAVTAVANTNGTWQYTTNGGALWNAFGTPTNNAARLLAADANTSVRFVPSAHWNGTLTGGLTFRAWDQTSGTAGNTANTSTNGDTSAFSAATASASITVNTVNDAPAGTDNTLTTNEDTGYTFTVADFGFTDPNDSPANSMNAVRISTLPGAGTLTNNGAAVSVNQSVSVADINLGRLVFTPAADANGTGHASFTFQVQDDGGTANSGSDLDASPNTLTVNVIAVNDAPAGTNNTVTTNEDVAYTFSATNFGFTDPDDAAANALTAVRLSSLPGAGTLTNNGAAVSVNQIISLADINLGRLVFTPMADASGVGYASFTFQVQDDGGTANGGSDLDASPNTLTVNVTAVNDAPLLSGANNLNAINEDVTSGANSGTLVSALIAGQLTDADSSAASGIAVTAVANTNGTWQYTTNGGGLWNAFGTPTDATARLLAANANTSVRFVPNAHWNGTLTGGLTFRAWDQTSGSAGSTADASTNGGTSAFSAATASASITVNAVNDAPAGADNTVTTSEDTGYTFTVADFGFTDPNDSPANSMNAVRISTLPGAGTLTNNGAAVSVNQSVSVADINAGRLVFTPTPEASGAGYASFTFRVRDNGGTTNGGINLDASPNTLTVNVTATNDAPANTVPTAQATAFDTPLVFSSGNGNRVSVADIDAGGASTEVALSATNGTLALAGTAGLTFTAGADASSSMTFSGSLTSINTALATLTFTPTAGFSGTATISIASNDLGNSGIGGPRSDADSISVTVNPSTTLVISGDAFTAAEDAILNAGSVLANDSDPALGVLSVSAVNGNGAAVNGTIALASGAIVSMQSDGSFTYDPNGAFESLAQGATTIDSFSYAASSSSGGTGAGTVLITVNGANDAPILAGANDLNAVDEDMTGASGTLVSALIAGQLTDADSAAASGIAVVTVANTNGTWEYTTNGGGLWNAFGTPTDATARLLAANANTSVRFVPNAHWNGTLTGGLTFRAWDQTSGSAGSTADASTNGGNSAFSAATASAGITVNPVNDAPAGTNLTVTTNEDTGYTFTVADFGFIDADDAPANALAAVHISSLPSAGTITNNGAAVSVNQSVSVADINLGRLVFTPAADANGTGYASFTFQVQDDGGTANGGSDLDASPNTLTVNVIAVNDAPAGTSSTVTTNEDTGYTFTVADFGFTDADDAPANALAAVRLSSLPSAGTLTNNGAAVSVNQTISLADINLGRLVFTPAADANGTGYASFTFQVLDDGGTANAGSDLDASPNTLTVNVTAVNDAPLLSGANNLNAINEDVASGANSGTLVSALIAGQLTDADSAAASGIAVTAVANTNGTWQYTTNGGGLWNAFGTPTNNATRLLAADANTSVRFVPSAHWNGTLTGGLTFRAWDQTSGSAGSTADASTNGGNSAFSAATASAGITVNPVNDAPAGTDNTVSTNEDTGYTFTVADFGFTDADDAPANALAAVHISSLPSAGTLTNNGAAVSVNQSVSVADINLGRLVFTPAADANGTGYASFTFQVQDDGGTANGGSDLDASPNTLTVNVIAVNDAPLLSGANNLNAINEDVASGANSGTLVSALIAGQLTDADSAAASGIAVTAVANTNGTWQYTTNGGGLWNAFGTPTNNAARLLAADASTSVRFVPNAHWNGTLTGGLTFRAWDQTSGSAGSTADASTNGGTSAFSAATASASITVNPVNDAPAGTNLTVSTNEDTGYTFTVADFGFTDADDAPANALAAVRLSSLPSAGTLTNNGAAVSVNQTISLADINLGRLVFTPAADANGTGYASFTFQVQDDGGTANGGSDLDASPNTLTVNVIAVNDAPAGTSNTVTINEGVAYTVSAADFGFTDANDTPANAFDAVRISSLPGSGTLSNNGAPVSVNQAISVADINLGRLVFTPTSTHTVAFTFQVQDDGGTANGGIDIDIAARTLTFAAPVPAASAADAPPVLIIADATPPPAAASQPPTPVDAVVPASATATTPPATSSAPSRPAAPTTNLDIATADTLIPIEDTAEFVTLVRQAAAAEATSTSLTEAQLVNFQSGERRALLADIVTLVDEILSSSVRAEGSRASFEQVLTSLRAQGFIDQLDRLREDARQDFDMERSFAVTATGVTFGLSVAYVLWMVRSGVLMGSLLSSLPAWRVLDPLPVLSSGGDDESEDELFDTPPEDADQTREALRGY